MQKTGFWARALKVARSKIDVEHERGKKLKFDAVVETGESFNPFLDQGRQSIKYVAKELLRHPMFKSYLVMGPACFDYGALFEFPRL